MEKKAQLPAVVARIILVGFMGAGKSTVGPLLAQQLRWRFLDADRVLERLTGSSIGDIFSQQGEAAFRVIEAEVVGDLVREQHLVLALGGGAVETAAVRDALLNTPETCVAFLKAPLDVMISRCEQQPGADIRPVLKDRERLRSRFESRLPHYQNAHLVIETGPLSAEETSQQILSAVSARLKENTLA